MLYTMLILLMLMRLLFLLLVCCPWFEGELGGAVSLTVPAIWIGGTRDPIVPIEQQRETAALVPGGRIYEFDCGHDMPARTEEGMVAIMLAHFYDSVAPRNRRFRSSAQDLN